MVCATGLGYPLRERIRKHQCQLPAEPQLTHINSPDSQEPVSVFVLDLMPVVFLRLAPECIFTIQDHRKFTRGCGLYGQNWEVRGSDTVAFSSSGVAQHHVPSCNIFEALCMDFLLTHPA